MRGLTYPNTWTIGDWTFYEVHGLYGHDGKALFGYGDGSRNGRGEPVYGELYNTLEHAMAAAIAEKYTGPRGAGGTGVGTAADWFMRMIGADQLVAVEHRETQSALADVIAATAKHDGPIYRRAQAMETELDARGIVLARQAPK